jgi:hypothetical protein
MNRASYRTAFSILVGSGIALGLIFVATNGAAQVPCSLQTIEKQQAKIALEVSILLTNFETSWNMTFPSGAPKHRDGHLERIAAWNPRLNGRQEEAFHMNDGLGCIVFITKEAKDSIPNLCAPADVQASLAMEALREAWENSLNVPNKTALSAIRDGIPMIWAEEKTLYCILRPDAQYIGLSDKLELCAPK